ncbi:MAG: hypothetical protein FWD63_06380 [Propionibacteriaceae bacterium]|nr:hypothetical protein [Propionibacteriaceae bacterium]
MRRLGNVLIVCAAACLVCMTVILVHDWLTYVYSPLDSVDLWTSQFLVVFVWVFIAAVLGVPGVVLRRVSAPRQRAD